MSPKTANEDTKPSRLSSSDRAAQAPVIVSAEVLKEAEECADPQGYLTTWLIIEAPRDTALERVFALSPGVRDEVDGFLPKISE